MKTTTKHENGIVTTTILGEKTAVLDREKSYLKRYSKPEYRAERVEYFERPDGTLEISLVRNDNRLW